MDVPLFCLGSTAREGFSVGRANDDGIVENQVGAYSSRPSRPNGTGLRSSSASWSSECARTLHPGSWDSSSRRTIRRSLSSA